MAVLDAEKSWKKSKGKGEDSERLAVCLTGLGYFYACASKFDWSENLYVKALQIWEGLHGKASPKLVELACDVAQVYAYNKNHKKALEVAEPLLKIAATPELQATVLATLGIILNELGKIDEATVNFKKAVDLAADLKPKDSVLVLGHYRNFLHKNKKADEAKKIDDEIKMLVDVLEKEAGP
eukprot:TRINITY_DN2427_c0_g1_i1.p1 TRINITY_DN2427_c0_g1~~TRINITY_DN2427_c0_g1_i1.p1  ORF type:complete len:197 (-),score=21.18 TRINITY_DN2427_c0_g1_i1:67-612(-)